MADKATSNTTTTTVPLIPVPVQHPSDTVDWVKDPIVTDVDDFIASTPVPLVTPVIPVTPGATANTTMDSAGTTLVQNISGNQGTGGNIFGQFFSWLGDTWQHSNMGSILLFSGAVALIVLGFWLANRGSDSSVAKKENPGTVASPKTAAQTLSAVSKDLSNTSSMLINLGADPTTVKTTSNSILLERGTDIAAAERQYFSKLPMVANNTHETRVVTSPKSPSHYADLNTMDMPLYVKSISHPLTPTAILDNSAAIHGATPMKKQP